MLTDKFLNLFQIEHSTTSKGSGFLKNWKEDGTITIWVHPTAPIYSLWGHSFRRYDTSKDDNDNEVIEIRSMRINCLEKETLLKKQRFREKDGSREMPPVICPHCKSIEWVRAQIASDYSIAHQRRMDLVSALNMLSKWSGLPLSMIPANAEFLRQKFKNFHHVQVGASKRRVSWSDIVKLNPGDISARSSSWTSPCRGTSRLLSARVLASICIR